MPDMDRDDQDWARILSGHLAPDARPDTRAEAEGLRRAILAASKTERLPEFDMEHGLQRLLFQLRQQKLAGKRRRGAWQAYAGVAMAASLALVVGLTVMRPDTQDVRDYGTEPSYRGAAPQVLTTDKPREIQAGIQRDLAAIGIEATIIQLGSVVTIEADLPQPTGKAALDILARYGLNVPEGGHLVVELRTAPPTPR